jgi:paraquat-inducible protein A
VTLALLISSYALYIPANIFPIMTVNQFGVIEKHTIIGGIVALVEKDMTPIALLVFIASIMVPLLKLLGISLLLLNVRLRWQRQPRLWMRAYRLIVFVGRWSMLDIFMISILVAVVDLSGGVSQVIAGPAATAFAAVVVLTMLAAKSFDPRLIWDKQKRP